MSSIVMNRKSTFAIILAGRRHRKVGRFDKKKAVTSRDRHLCSCRVTVRVYDLSGFVENSGAHRNDARRAGADRGWQGTTALYAHDARMNAKLQQAEAVKSAASAPRCRSIGRRSHPTDSSG